MQPGGAVQDSRADVPALCYGKRPDRLLLLIQQLKQLKRELGRGPLRPGGGPGPGPGPRDGGRRRLKQEDTTPREDEASPLEESIPSVTSPFPCMIYPNGVRACGVVVEARVTTTILSSRVVILRPGPREALPLSPSRAHDMVRGAP